jgi:phosphatidylglycerol---prolipoprotein diacylglyceryl transferase
MYPVLFRIGEVDITSFGVLVAIGALAGLWILQRELKRSGLPAGALDAGLAGVVGGLAGAKLLWVLEHLGEEPVVALLFSRGGMSWFGGFVGGLLAGLVVLRRSRTPIVPVLAAATPALAFGQLLGRIGCFLVGDDYGTPSSLPWAVPFPQGLPPTTAAVHPTQVYEAIGLSALGWMLLRWRRRGVEDRVVLGRYLVGAGALRFAIEFIRVNVRIAWGLSVAHLVSLAVMLTGAVLLFAVARRPERLADVG